MSKTDLGDMVRQKVLAGILPEEQCRMTWYGPGRGAVCVVCEQAIVGNDVEVECILPGGNSIVFHRLCYDAWAQMAPSSGV